MAQSSTDRARMVPESRIKRLVCLEAAALGAVVDRETAKRNLCQQMGRAIAEKLFEFNKVNVWMDAESGFQIAEAIIDVIVPDGPPHRSARFVSVDDRIEKLIA